MKRPIYFLLAFWGPRYREYLIERSLPSLLAPNNLPLLRAQDGHRFIFATTKEDWRAIEHLPIMEKIRAYASPMLIEMNNPEAPTPPGSSPAIIQQNVFQKELVKAAFADRAYACLVWPDLMYSDGMVAALMGHARAGRKVVLCAALRQTEETVIAELERNGHILPGSRLSETAQPIVLSARYVADLAVRHLHSEVKICEEDRPGQPLLTIHRYWPVLGHTGIILHSFLYAPFLMDFSSIETHDTQCLDEDTFENVYVYRNFFKGGDIHVVQDSDEFGIVSLTPTSVTQVENSQQSHHRFWDSRMARQWGMRASMKFNGGLLHDSLKLWLFRRPVRWHAGDLDAAWHRKERSVEAMIRAALGDYFRASDTGRPPRRFSLSPWRLPVDVYLNNLLTPRDTMARRLMLYGRIIFRAVSGNRGEMRRILSAVRRRATAFIRQRRLS